VAVNGCYLATVLGVNGDKVRIEPEDHRDKTRVVKRDRVVLFSPECY
jgi:hypothetical protein